MSERRHHEDRRQRGLRIVPTELPAPLEEAPFLRPNRRTRVRRARRGWMGRSILLLEATGGVVVVASALWISYSRVMASERLRVDKVEVRGSHFLSEGEVRDGMIICPWHESHYRIADGHVVHGPSTYDQPCYATRVSDGVIEVRLA